jgi:hypothetical protein
MLTSTEGLGSESTPAHKVTLRVKPTTRRHSERPWSVSCLSQLQRNSQQSLIDVKMVETSRRSAVLEAKTPCAVDVQNSANSRTRPMYRETFSGR